MKTRWMIIILLLTATLFIFSAVFATPDATIIDRYVIGGGGGRTEVGIYTLDGTIGQAVAGVSATSTTLCSGFWCGIMGGHTIYLPLVLNTPP
ncbi:MAG: hypothetical protein JXA42_16015 [Anaerolineales bacterium]|nr:hypothetical protein [Anaerolineales bacterium]